MLEFRLPVRAFSVKQLVRRQRIPTLRKDSFEERGLGSMAVNRVAG